LTLWRKIIVSFILGYCTVTSLSYKNTISFLFLFLELKVSASFLMLLALTEDNLGFGKYDLVGKGTLTPSFISGQLVCWLVKGL